MSTAGIDAVTFDFFNTLIFHRDGKGRGAQLIEYFQDQGLSPRPWEHEILYEVFDIHAEGHPTNPMQAHPADEDEYATRLAGRLFRCLGVFASDREIRRHVAPIWRILGPACFGVFPEVMRTLRALRASGHTLAVISNWPRGLSYFCDKLKLSDHFEFILASGEVGAAKPDIRIFAEAASRLGAEPGRVVHVGDSLVDDYCGASAAGFEALLVDRDGSRDAHHERVIERLDQLPIWIEARSGCAAKDGRTHWRRALDDSGQ
jgi:FMN phosphatase YigB (HAD superfamily)